METKYVKLNRKKYFAVGTKVVMVTIPYGKKVKTVVRIDGYKMLNDQSGGYDVIYSPINIAESQVAHAEWLNHDRIEVVDMNDSEFYTQRSQNTGLV